MKKLMKIVFPILVFACLFAVFGVSSSAAEGSYYDLWVGGVAVNPANERDVLGDGKVSFDPDTRTLTLNGATIDGYYASEYGYYLSVYCKNKIDVVIKGKTRLKHGIRVDGNVTVEDAQLTFSDSAMTAFCLYGSDSKITLKNSTVKASGSALDVGQGIPLFHAEDISLQKSELSVSFTAEANPVDWVVHATGKLTVTDSDIEINHEIPTSRYALYANTEMTFTDSSVALKAPMYAFYAPQGTISFIRSAVTVDRGFYALQAEGLRMENAAFEADVFYDGIFVASNQAEDVPGEEDKVTVKPTEVVFTDSTVRVTQLAYSRLKSMLSKLWENMSPEARLEYGNSKATFLSAYAEKHDASTRFTAGFRGFCTSVSLLRSKVKLEEFTLGYYATGTSSLYISEGSELKLEAERAAFVMFTNAQNAVTVSEKLRASKNIYAAEIMGNLAVLGEVLYTYSGKKPSIDLSVPYSETTPEDLFTALSGVSDTLHFYPANPANRIYLWIALGVGGGVLLLGGALTAVLLIRHRRKIAAEKQRYSRIVIVSKRNAKKPSGKKRRK